MCSMWSLFCSYRFYHLCVSIPDTSNITPVEKLTAIFFGNSVGNNDDN